LIAAEVLAVKTTSCVDSSTSRKRSTAARASSRMRVLARDGA
jgi:hypothetical protein